MSIPEFAVRPQLAEDVARLIRRRIFDGTYPAGKYIRLEQLADELGISVTPVREALFGLRTEGLLTQRPRRGFLVLPVTRRDIDDVAAVQGHIGGELASRAARHITDGAVAGTRTDPEAARRGLCGRRSRASGAPQPRIPPRRQPGRGLAQAGAADVPDHPVRPGIGVPHRRGLAEAVHP